MLRVPQAEPARLNSHLSQLSGCLSVFGSISQGFVPQAGLNPGLRLSIPSGDVFCQGPAKQLGLGATVAMASLGAPVFQAGVWRISRAFFALKFSCPGRATQR